MFQHDPSLLRHDRLGRQVKAQNLTMNCRLTREDLPTITSTLQADKPPFRVQLKYPLRTPWSPAKTQLDPPLGLRPHQKAVGATIPRAWKLLQLLLRRPMLHLRVPPLHHLRHLARGIQPQATGQGKLVGMVRRVMRPMKRLQSTRVIMTLTLRLERAIRTH